MPNQDFAQELKEEFKKGNIKPSQLKKSKSTEHLTIPKPEITLTKSKSAEQITSLSPSLAEQVKQLKQELVFSQNNAQNYLARLQKLEPELDKQETELKKLQEVNNQLVDQNNELRLNSLKNSDKLTEYEAEITQAATKLSTIQQKQINYQVQNQQLLREKKDLENQLKNSQQRIQKLYQLKGLPHTAHPAPLPTFSTLCYTSLLVLTTIYLLQKE